MPPQAHPSTPHQYPIVPRLTAAQEQDLAARRMAGGDEAEDARELLIVANIPRALSLAIKFRAGQYSRHGDDLKSVAISGLIHAADKYRPGIVSRGKLVKFGTYAKHWIRQRMELATSEDLSTVHIPRWVVEAMQNQTSGNPVAKRFIGFDVRDAVASGERVRGIEGYGWNKGEDDPIREMQSRDREPWEELAAREVSPTVSRALCRLSLEHPLEYRVIVRVKPIDDRTPLTITEAAPAVGCCRKIAGEAYRRGLRRLAEYIREDGDGERLAGRCDDRREAC